ncbi:MAG TPA: hypothetical protein VMT16_17255 [Thermoanaerobaculia bacterium]|nr:hypothetical protein [Thermoanaerobaculia bacterium]
MPQALPLGLLSWIAAGLLLGLAAPWALRRWSAVRIGWSLAVGIAAAVGGGLIATSLGFGGLLGFDPRGLASAALTALLALLLLALGRPPEP